MSLLKEKLKKHLHISDYVSSDDCTLVRHHKPTLKHVAVSETQIAIEEVKDEPSLFNYRDFSVRTILESGNLDLLKGVGTIPDSLLTAHDKVFSTSDSIDNFVNNNLIEE